MKTLDDAVGLLINNHYHFERAYAPIDEIALGGIARWFIPPAVGDKIYERIKIREGDPIVLVSLLGHGRGSSFFFEENCLKKKSFLPGHPPYELLSEEARANKTIPLLGFSQSHNEIPVYRFDSNGNYSYNNLDSETLKSIWHENVKKIAFAYKNNGNVFSINAFRDFYAYPVLSGITVDALREGLGANLPIWLYFDGNGYAKPANVSPEDYVNNVKCQIYTSLIHGATGIFFWNDWSKTPEVFDVLLPMLKELNGNLNIIYLKTIEKKIEGNLHIMIKEDEKRKRYIIASTGKTESLPLNLSGVGKKTISPLEVYISGI